MSVSSHHCCELAKHRNRAVALVSVQLVAIWFEMWFGQEVVFNNLLLSPRVNQRINGSTAYHDFCLRPLASVVRHREDEAVVRRGLLHLLRLLCWPVLPQLRHFWSSAGQLWPTCGYSCPKAKHFFPCSLLFSFCDAACCALEFCAFGRSCQPRVVPCAPNFACLPWFCTAAIGSFLISGSVLPTHSMDRARTVTASSACAFSWISFRVFPAFSRMCWRSFADAHPRMICRLISVSELFRIRILRTRRSDALQSRLDFLRRADESLAFSSRVEYTSRAAAPITYTNKAFCAACVTPDVKTNVSNSLHRAGHLVPAVCLHSSSSRNGAGGGRLRTKSIVNPRRQMDGRCIDSFCKMLSD
ncbi:hypothetical protein BpHYR1_024803 [Brachionus plicatilis]|uniref:Uncharacterized protein n=1 Tax=Brachionus plicatilis TaxID=10195 RepID=A0A3M7RY38_BRAPC|nr:hypothetical protein BpHYR1_024803 [Brachionus plicatilis]